MMLRPSLRLFLHISLLCFLLLAGLSSGAPGAVVAYYDTDGWTAPINLSHSGSAGAPQLIVDAAGRFHAVWLDAYDGYVHSTSDDGVAWSTPIAVRFPFGVRDMPPVLAADSAGMIHAFWRDSRSALMYSRATAREFGNAAVWPRAVRLAEAVADFDVAADQAGVLHLAYVLTALQDSTVRLAPAGIYYRQSTNSGATWSASQALYQSPYLRSVASDQAKVSVALSGAGSSVFVVWDNRPINRILFARSDSGGSEWTEPAELARPNADTSTATPFNGLLAANEQGVLFIWQTGAPGAACFLNSQWSQDGGASWGHPVAVFGDTLGCPQDIRLTLIQDGLIVVQASLNNQVLLVAWNGSQWGNPQRVLSSYADPDTQNSVALGCQTVIADVATHLFTIGCDQVGGDIWLSSRRSASVADWFPPPSDWSPPSAFAAASSDVTLVSLAADNADHVNAVWVEDFRASDVITSTISYAKWDGQQWAQPAAIASSLEGAINHLDAATDGDRLLVVWSEGVTGQIYFSWANLARAHVPAEWVRPVQLLASQTVGTTPNLMVDAPGSVAVAYAIPVNENRGIYLIKSAEIGETWSAPVQIFDATAAAWNMVIGPQVQESGGGAASADWLRYPLPGSGGPLGLYSAHSSDAGLTWSEALPIAEGNITWNSLLGRPGAAVHRLWQMAAGNERIVWNQFSSDGGFTWSSPASITGLGSFVGTPAATIDAGGRLHLFLARRNSALGLDILHWLWEDGNWSRQGALEVGDNNGFTPGYLAAAVSPSGKLVMVYPGTVTDASSDRVLHALYYSSKLVEAPAAAPTALAIVPPPASETPAPAATPTPVPLPTEQVSEAPPQPAVSDSPWAGVLAGGGLGGGLAAVLVAAFVAYRVIAARRK